MLKIKLLVFLFFIAGSFSALSYDLNDFSNIIPIRKNISDDKKIDPIFLDVFSFQAEVLNSISLENINGFQLVSYRFVPCREEEKKRDCTRPEIRLIFQNIKMGKYGLDYNAKDQVLHFFFELTQEQFREFFLEHSELRGFKNKDSDKILVDYLNFGNNNPESRKKLIKFISNVIQKGRFYQFTFMDTVRDEKKNIKWFFGGFFLENGQWVSKVKDGSHSEFYKTQVEVADLTDDRMSASHFEKRLENIIDQDYLKNLVKKILPRSSRKDKEEGGKLIKKMRKEVLRMESPEKNHAGTTSCLSCHTLLSRRNYLDTLASKFLKKSDFSYLSKYQKYMRSYSDFNVVEKEVTTFQAFSYLGKASPVISQRVINDTVYARRYMLKHYDL